MVVYEYFDPDLVIAITKESEITANLQKTKKSFVGIRPRSKAGDMWFQVYLGFDEDKEEVTGNTVWWYQQQQSNLY